VEYDHDITVLATTIPLASADAGNDSVGGHVSYQQTA
jgi:hypothetical protein